MATGVHTLIPLGFTALDQQLPVAMNRMRLPLCPLRGWRTILLPGHRGPVTVPVLLIRPVNQRAAAYLTADAPGFLISDCDWQAAAGGREVIGIDAVGGDGAALRLQLELPAHADVAYALGRAAFAVVTAGPLPQTIDGRMQLPPGVALLPTPERLAELLPGGEPAMAGSSA